MILPPKNEQNIQKSHTQNIVILNSLTLTKLIITNKSPSKDVNVQNYIVKWWHYQGNWLACALWRQGRQSGTHGILRDPLSISMSNIKVNEKLQQPRIKGRVHEDSDPLEMKVQITPPSKESRPTQVPAEGKGTTNQIEKNVSHRYQLQSWEQLQKWGLQYLCIFSIGLLYHFLSLLLMFILYSSC